MTERLFAVRAEIARLMRCDPRSVDRMIEAGVIPAVRVARVVRIPIRPFCDATHLRPEDVFAQLADIRGPEAETSPPLAVVRRRGAAA